jgi:hypothetical protein
VSGGGGPGPGGTMEVPTLTIFCHEGRPPADDIFAYWGCPQPVPARLLAQVPDPRKRRGRRHALAGLLATGIAGSRSFAAIVQWAADAGPEALAVLGAARARLKSPPSGAPSPWSAPTCSTGSSVPARRWRTGSAQSSARSPWTRNRTRSPRRGTCWRRSPVSSPRSLRFAATTPPARAGPGPAISLIPCRHRQPAPGRRLRDDAHPADLNLRALSSRGNQAESFFGATGVQPTAATLRTRSNASSSVRSRR